MSTRVLDQIFARLKKCEEELQKKEKEKIAYECDINALKISHLDLEQELKTLKKKSQQQKEDIVNLTTEKNKHKKEITDTKNKLDGLIDQNLVPRGITRLDRKSKSKDGGGSGGGSKGNGSTTGLPRNQKYDLEFTEEWTRKIGGHFRR